MRDTFRREFAKTQNSRSGDAGGSSKKIKWAYFELMLFLKDTLTSRSSTGNITRDEGNERQSENEDNNEASEEFADEGQLDQDEITQINETENSAVFRTPARDKMINEHRSKLQQKRKGSNDVYERLINIEEQKLETFSAKNKLHNDSNYHFLMSLLPLMQALPPLQNMQRRLDIQQLFLNDQYQYLDTPPSTIPPPQASPAETYSSTSTELPSEPPQQDYSPPTDCNTQYQDPLSIDAHYPDTSSIARKLETTARYFHTFK